MNAQEINYAEIDKNSFDLYQKADWENLTLFAEKQSKSVDYYYFNIRVGIAYYNLKEYYKAEKYFSKAVHNYSNDFALVYLYWSYLYMGQTDKAQETYEKLSTEEQNKIQKEKNWIESIYVEGGLKFSDSYLKGDLSYLSLHTFHKLSDKVSLYDGISKINQENEFEKNSQFQLNLFPSFYLNKWISLNTGLVYAKTKSNYETSYDTYTSTTNLDINNFAFYAGISKQYRRVYAELYGYYISQNLTANENSLGQILTTKTSGNTKIAGINLAYLLPLIKNKITIGSMLYSASDSATNNVLLSPYTLLNISPKIWLKASYFSVKETYFVDKSSEIFYTNKNISLGRYAYNFGYNATTHWQFIGTYSLEKVQDSLILSNYNLYSYFLGINYKL